MLNQFRPNRLNSLVCLLSSKAILTIFSLIVNERKLIFSNLRFFTNWRLLLENTTLFTLLSLLSRINIRS